MLAGFRDLTRRDRTDDTPTAGPIDSIIVLLVGGDKGSQAKDIAQARGFWRDYLEAKRHGKTT